MSENSLGAKATLSVGGADYEIFRLDAVPGLEKLPYSLKILAEALLRIPDGETADRLIADKIPAALVRIPGGPALDRGHSYVDYMNEVVARIVRALASKRGG